MKVKAKYITDNKGNKKEIIIPIKEYEKIINENNLLSEIIKNYQMEQIKNAENDLLNGKYKTFTSNEIKNALELNINII